jgi:hypothetical protein
LAYLSFLLIDPPSPLDTSNILPIYPREIYQCAAANCSQGGLISRRHPLFDLTESAVASGPHDVFETEVPSAILVLDMRDVETIV